MEAVFNRVIRTTMLSVVALMALAIACLLGPLASKAYAAGVNFDDLSSKAWVMSATVPQGGIWPGVQYFEFVDSEGADLSEVEITNVKSSNPKVAKARAEDFFLAISYSGRVGKTIISCTVNDVPLKHVFEVRYTCPVSKFKVGGASMLKKFKKKHLVKTKKTFKNKKVIIKAKKGWVIKHITLVKSGRYKEIKGKNRKSYTAKITTEFEDDGITALFENKKTGEQQEISFEKAYTGRSSAQAG